MRSVGEQAIPASTLSLRCVAKTAAQTLRRGNHIFNRLFILMPTKPANTIVNSPVKYAMSPGSSGGR